MNLLSPPMGPPWWAGQKNWPSLTIAVFIWCIAATGCAGPGASADDVEPTIELPADWHQRDFDGEIFDDQWCTDFGDPELRAVIDIVLEDNLDLLIAQTRLDEARSLLAQNRSVRHPQVGGQIAAETEGNREGWASDYEISAPATYEVDLWGRIAREISASETDLEAFSADLRALEMVLATETAELYFELARSRSEFDILDDQIEAATTFLELTKIRQAQGMASAIDVVQQEQQIEELHEIQRQTELDETLVLNSLANLMGRSPSQIDIGSAHSLPETIPPVAEFLPADLLTRRPDVHAARLRVAAADDRIDAAIAERLPRLQLSASIGLQAANLQDLFTSLFVSAGGSLFQEFFDGGRRQGRIDEQSAILERQLLEFSSVLLDAIQEVEDTLATGQALYDILQIQRLQLESAQEALELARVQYRAGILDYLRVLTALQSIQELELSELDSRRRLLSQRIQLCRVAGGDWQESLNDKDDE